MIERGARNTILVVEKSLSKELIHQRIENHCEGTIHAFTDDYTIYSKLEEHSQVKKHHIINHSEKEYANNENHVNNAENRHSLLKPFLNIFRGVSKKNLNTYVKFFQFTFNNRINWLKKALETSFRGIENQRFSKALKIILDQCTTSRR